MSKETSEQMAAIAARYVNITADELRTIQRSTIYPNFLEQVAGVIRSLSGSVLSQRELMSPTMKEIYLRIMRNERSGKGINLDWIETQHLIDYLRGE